MIGLLDTPPCLVLALANDEGYTAYCHTDLTHTLPGVLLRWIAGKPTFVCNSHFPHDGIFTVAHCAAPRKMNGKDYEPADIMTHYESDYGAATKVQYTKGQTVTVIVPALDCTKWQGFRGKIRRLASRPACRSQMDIQIDGDWRQLLTDQVGFHAQVVLRRLPPRGRLRAEETDLPCMGEFQRGSLISDPVAQAAARR